jgi:hypothetical protein
MAPRPSGRNTPSAPPRSKDPVQTLLTPTSEPITCIESWAYLPAKRWDPTGEQAGTEPVDVLRVVAVVEQQPDRLGLDGYAIGPHAFAIPMTF